MSADIKEILTNPEVLAVHKDPSARMATRIDVGGGVEEQHAAHLCQSSMSVYGKMLSDGSSAVMFLNRGIDNVSFSFALENVGDSMHYSYFIRDLWQHKNLTSSGSVLRLNVPAHGVRLLRLWPKISDCPIGFS